MKGGWPWGGGSNRDGSWASSTSLTLGELTPFLPFSDSWSMGWQAPSSSLPPCIPLYLRQLCSLVEVLDGFRGPKQGPVRGP